MSKSRLIAAGLLALTWLSPAQALDLSEEALKAADQSKGLQTFSQYCGACHTLMEGGGNLLGPNLGSLFKRKAGVKEGFDFSDAFKGTDLAWTPENFAAFMQDPEGYIPDNRMMMPPVPEDKIVDLTAYVAVRTGSVEWGSEDDPSANVATMEGSKLTPLEQQLYDTRQDFWHHLFENTAHYIIQTPEGEDGYTFVAYFNEDGTMSGNFNGLQGFWRVNDLKKFCYALEGIPVAPYEWNECFPIVPNSVERYGQGLWVSEPVPGLKVKGGFLQGRPHPLAGDAHPGYWDNLFTNTMRYEVKVGDETKIINAQFNEDKTISSPEGVSGKWYVQGEDTDNAEMCYTLSNVSMFENDLSECFALVLMFNPRIGARWPSRFEDGTMYWAEVTEGRQ